MREAFCIERISKNAFTRLLLDDSPHGKPSMDEERGQ